MHISDFCMSVVKKIEVQCTIDEPNVDTVLTFLIWNFEDSKNYWLSFSNHSCISVDLIFGRFSEKIANYELIAVRRLFALARIARVSATGANLTCENAKNTFFLVSIFPPSDKLFKNTTSPCSFILPIASFQNEIWGQVLWFVLLSPHLA